MLYVQGDSVGLDEAEAEKWLTKASGKGLGSEADAHYNLGNLRRGRGDFDGAVRHYQVLQSASLRPLSCLCLSCNKPWLHSRLCLCDAP